MHENIFFLHQIKDSIHWAFSKKKEKKKNHLLHLKARNGDSNFFFDVMAYPGFTVKTNYDSNHLHHHILLTTSYHSLNTAMELIMPCSKRIPTDLNSAHDCPNPIPAVQFSKSEIQNFLTVSRAFTLLNSSPINLFVIRRIHEKLASSY